MSASPTFLIAILACAAASVLPSDGTKEPSTDKKAATPDGPGANVTPASIPPGRTACPDLPEPISSFGAAVSGDWLYVYSGHTGEAHAHSRDNLSKRFLRINLAKPAAWESLPMGLTLQSVALIAHGGGIYRVGGLNARNAAEEPEEVTSTTEFQRYDPDRRVWEPRTPLPAGRSSHDAAVANDTLYVVGGWQLDGDKRVWHDSAWKIRLDDPKATWQDLPRPPFRRRALAVAIHGDKLYAIGGMKDDNKPSIDVHVLDLKRNEWQAGPALPGDKPIAGFGCSAASLPSGLYVTAMSGEVYRLDASGQKWSQAAKLAHPRFFHRLVPVGNDLLLAIAGASHRGHLASSEWVVPK